MAGGEKSARSGNVSSLFPLWWQVLTSEFHYHISLTWLGVGGITCCIGQGLFGRGSTPPSNVSFATGASLQEGVSPQELKRNGELRQAGEQ